MPISSTFPSSLDNVLNMEMVDGEVNATDDESMLLHIGKLVERFYLKDKVVADKFNDFSKFMDESNAAMLRKLDIMKDRMITMIELIKSLKKRVKDMETDKQRQENAIDSLGSDIRILFSACADATRELELDVKNNKLESRSVQKLVNLEDNISMYSGIVGGDEAAALVSDNCAKTAERLLFAARQSRDLSKQFQDAINKLVNSIDNIQNKLEETELTRDEVLKVRDINRDRILKLETDLEARQNLCNEMSLALENYRIKEATVKEREADFSSVDSTTLSQVQGTFYYVDTLS